MIGYICSDLTVGKCAFFLQGQPNSGKSVIAEFISRLFDPSLVSNVPLHQLGERFSRAELAGKKVNIAGEDCWESLTGHLHFQVCHRRRPYHGRVQRERPLLFHPTVQAAVCRQHATADDRGGYHRQAFANRLVVLLFNQSIPPEKQDKSLLDRLCKGGRTPS